LRAAILRLKKKALPILTRGKGEVSFFMEPMMEPMNDDLETEPEEGEEI